jgi:antitoxin component YwqK of YwqJK toxin-antitoxin module
MLRSLPLVLFVCCFFAARAQQPDSVLYNGEWYFVYPIRERVDPDMRYLQKVGLIETEFALYRSWQQTGDPRGTLHGRALHRELEKELIASKRMTAETYIRKRAALQHERWRVINSYISIPTGERPENYSFRRKVRLYPELLINQEIDVEYDLVPYVGDLPDGKYIQYFDDFYTYKRQRKMKRNELRIAGVFELSENQLNGTYARYSYFGDTLRTGSFVHGQREGTWLITGKKEVRLRSHFSMLRHLNWVTYEHHYVRASFHEGKLNGRYESWIDGKLKLSGNYENGLMTGEWFRRGKYPLELQLRFDLLKEQGTIGDTTPVLNLWEAEKLGRPRPGPERFTLSAADHWKGQYIWKLHYGRKKAGSSLKPLFEGLPLAGEDDPVDDPVNYASPYNYGFSTYFSGDWIDYKELSDETRTVPAFRYLYDPQLRAILGSHYYVTGTLCDTIGFDPSGERFFRKMYDSEGRLCYERTWDRQGNVLSTKEYKLPDSNIRMIEGLPAVPDRMNRACDSCYAWENPDSALIGAKNYNYINWYSVNGPRLSEAYTDTLTGEEIQIDYNRFGEAASTLRITYDGDAVGSLYEDVRWGELKIVSGWKKTAGNQWTEHPVVYKNDTPYTGKLIFRATALSEYRVTGNGLEIDARITKGYDQKSSAGSRNQGAGLPQATLMRLGENGWTRQFKTAFGYIDLRAVAVMEGELVNGKLYGNWQFYDEKHRLLFALDYDTEGKPSGVYREYDTKMKSARYLRKSGRLYPNIARYRPVAAHTIRYLKKSYTLEHGAVNGSSCVYNFRGDTMELQQYDQGVLHGKQVAYTDSKIATMQYDHGVKTGHWSVVSIRLMKDNTGGSVRFDTLISFHLDANGRPEGRVVYAPVHDLSRTAVYHAGRLEELLLRDYKTGLPEAEFRFNNGLLLQKTAYHNGEVSAVYTCTENDSVRITDDELEGEIDNPGIFNGTFQFEKQHHYPNEYVDHITDGLPASYFTKLDPMGKPARRGRMRSTQKTGMWEFFAYGGKLLYTIDYKGFVYENEDGDSFLTAGTYTEFDSLGNVLSRRLVIAEEEKYTCADDDYYAVREFITIEDRPDTLERTNGMIRNYYDDGMLMSEGLLEKGLPVGVWKFYTPDGKLYRVGRYEKGFKEGRWLSGDLADKKYIGDICLNPDDANLDLHIAQLERELDIRVEHYKQGVLQSRQLYTIEK